MTDYEKEKVVHWKSYSSARAREISAVLSRAFMRDPFYTYIMPEEDSRRMRMNWWMNCMVRYGYEYGKIFTTPDPIAGAAVWLTPESPMVNLMKMARMGLMRAPVRLGICGFSRLMEVSSEWEHLHKREACRHWYLMILGTDPICQRRGLGSSLLRPVLQDADREGIPCYLETMTAKDVEFYRKRGFEIAAMGWVGKHIPYWTMRRSPRSP